MFVIVNVGTESCYRGGNSFSVKLYETERGAKGACTRLNKQYSKEGQWENLGQWVVMDENDYRMAHPVKMVTRRNLMSGKEYQEAEDTPLCCSPASETYWSM